MTVAVHDHIHLSTSDPPTDVGAEYPAAHGTLDWTPNVSVTTERSLTGKLHTHRLLDGADPKQFRSDRMTLTLTLAQMLVVRGLSGKRVYFAFNYHDDEEDPGPPPSLKSWAAGSIYVVRCVLVLETGSISNLDPKSSYWQVNIRLTDDTIT